MASIISESEPTDAFSDVSVSKWSNLSGVINSGRHISLENVATADMPSATQLELQQATQKASNTLSRLVLQVAMAAANIIDYETIEVGRHIGMGASVNVYEGRTQGKTVALKIARTHNHPQPGNADSKQSLAAISLELKFLLSDNIRQHPNIVQLLGLTWKPETEEMTKLGFFIKPILVVQLASSETPTLDVLIQSLDSHDFSTKAELISDIVQGIDAVHGEFFIHGDLKPENILIFPRESKGLSNYIAKLSDFGFSDDTELSAVSRDWKVAGTEYWSPPECFVSPQIDGTVGVRSESRDLYALGLLIWFILASELPFGPDRGREWAENRQHVLALKKNGEVKEKASSFLEKCLSPLRPVADIVQDVLQITLFNGPTSADGSVIAVHPEVASDLELVQWLQKLRDSDIVRSDDLLSQSGKDFTSLALRLKDIEFSDPEHPRSTALLEELDLEDSSHSKARFILLDELLFRRKLVWTMNKTPCKGYLPYAVVEFPRLLSKIPSDRGTGRQWLRYLYTSPERFPSNVDSWRPLTQSSLRGGWSEVSERTTQRDSLLRNIRANALPQNMMCSLDQQIHHDATAAANPNDAKITAILRRAIRDLEDGDVSEMPKAGSHQPTTYSDVSGREMKLAFHVAEEPLPSLIQVDEAKLPEFCMENLCTYFYESEKESGRQPVHDSFFRLMRDVLDTTDYKTQRRMPRLWYDVYSKPERIQTTKLSTAMAIARPKLPGFNEEEAALVSAIRRDDVIAFIIAHQQGRLPKDIDPNRDGAVPLLILIMELHLKEILRYSLENSLLSLDPKMNGTSTPLQWSCSKGLWTTTATLLDLGADVSPLFHSEFIEETITYGSRRAIGILHYIQLVASAYPRTCRMTGSVQLVKKFDFNAICLRTRPTDTTRESSAIHLSILENAWTAFTALLSVGVDVEQPCCGGMTPLQWSVGLLRPLFVGALVDSGVNPNIRAAQTLETPLHEVVRLNTGRWPNRWIYGDSEELRTSEDARRDDQIHANLILEILLRAPTLDLDARDGKGQTAFLSACEAGKLDMCKRLYAAGACPFAKMLDGQNALHLAISAKGVSEQAELMAYLCSTWPELIEMKGYEERPPLFDAIESTDHGLLATLLHYQPSLTATDVFGANALHIAILSTNFVAFETLLKHYGETDPDALSSAVNNKDAFGRNVCHHFAESAVVAYSTELETAFQHQLEVFEQQVLPLADTTSQNDNLGWTPVHFAALAAPEVLRCFLSAKFNPNAAELHGVTPLHLSMAFEDTTNTQILRDASTLTLEPTLTFFTDRFCAEGQSMAASGVSPMQFLDVMNDTQHAILEHYRSKGERDRFKQLKRFSQADLIRSNIQNKTSGFEMSTPIRIPSRHGYLFSSANRWRGCPFCPLSPPKVALSTAEPELKVFECVIGSDTKSPTPVVKKSWISRSTAKLAKPWAGSSKPAPPTLIYPQMARLQALDQNLIRICTAANSLPDYFEVNAEKPHPPNTHSNTFDGRISTNVANQLSKLGGYNLRQQMMSSQYVAFNPKTGLISKIMDDKLSSEIKNMKRPEDVINPGRQT